MTKVNALPTDPADASDIAAAFAAIDAKLGTSPNLGSGATLVGNLEDMRDDGTQVYSRATDSLQAIRDRGDAAWVTGGGGGGDVTTIEGIDATNQITACVTAALANPTYIAAMGEAVLHRDWTTLPASPPARCLHEAARILRNKHIVGLDGILRVYKENDSTEAWNAVLTLDPAGQPITGVDPT